MKSPICDVCKCKDGRKRILVCTRCDATVHAQCVSLNPISIPADLEDMWCSDCVLALPQTSLRRIPLIGEYLKELHKLQHVLQGLTHDRGSVFYLKETVPFLSDGVSTPCLTPTKGSSLMKALQKHERLLQHIARCVTHKSSAKWSMNLIILLCTKARTRVHCDNPGRAASGYWTIGLGPTHTTALFTDLGYVVPHKRDVLYAWNGEHLHHGIACSKTNTFRAFLVVTRVNDENEQYTPAVKFVLH